MFNNEVLEMEHIDAPARLNTKLAEDFELLVKSYSAGYFNMGDVDSLVNLVTIKNEIQTLNSVISMVGNISNVSSLKRYNRYVDTRTKLINTQLRLETALRLSVNARREVRTNTLGMKSSENTNRVEKLGEREKTLNEDIWIEQS